MAVVSSGYSRINRSVSCLLPLPAAVCRAIDLAVGGGGDGPVMMAYASAVGVRTRFATRVTTMLDADVDLRDVQIAGQARRPAQCLPAQPSGGSHCDKGRPWTIVCPGHTIVACAGQLRVAAGWEGRVHHGARAGPLRVATPELRVATSTVDRESPSYRDWLTPSRKLLWSSASAAICSTTRSGRAGSGPRKRAPVESSPGTTYSSGSTATSPTRPSALAERRANLSPCRDVGAPVLAAHLTSAPDVRPPRSGRDARQLGI